MGAQHSDWQRGLLTRPRVCFALVIFLSAAAGCSDGSGDFPAMNAWEISVTKPNSSALMIEASSGTKEPFAIGDDFSNARRYLEMIDSDGEWNATLSSVSGLASSITYRVHFPIEWGGGTPYGMLSEEFGVASANFLFPRSDDRQRAYHLDFLKVGMNVHNSGFGDAKTYDLSEEDLFETYFVLGKVESDCAFSEGSREFRVVFGGEKKSSEDVCSNIRALLSYYTDQFGQPEEALQSYEIGFFPARAYSTLRSGFYFPKADYEFIAHELFHLWEPADKCRGNKVMEEMFASYFQVEAQYGAGIIGLDERNRLFEQKQMQLSAIAQEYLSFSDDKLVELRKRNASAYSTLVYSRGGLIGEMMQKEGALSKVLFWRDEGENCPSLYSMVEEYGRRLNEGITS
jgi:hypothetical protein